MSKFEINNAVLRKDMIIDMKRPKMLLLILGINLLLGGLLFFIFGTFYISEESFDPRFTITVFSALLWVVEGALIFLTPALTAGAISIEKERQTLEVLLTTRLTPWGIVLGKYFSTIIQVALLIISTIPIMSITFIYGGINLWQMFVVFAVLISAVMYIAAFGVFFSSLLKNTVLSVILTYISVGVVFSLTFFVTLFGMVGTLLVNELIVEIIYEYTAKRIEYVLSGDIFIAFMYWNPFATLFDVLGRIFGYNGLMSGEAFYGIKDLEIFTHFTNKNVLLVLWPFISIILQVGTAFLLLWAAAFFLKPVKRRRKKKEVKHREYRKRL